MDQRAGPAAAVPYRGALARGGRRDAVVRGQSATPRGDRPECERAGSGRAEERRPDRIHSGLRRGRGVEPRADGLDPDHDRRRQHERIAFHGGGAGAAGARHARCERAARAAG